MPKYMFLASYSADGTKGLLKEGGSKRKQVVEQLFKAIGGRVEAFYYALGEYDAVVIGDAPSNVDVAAVSLAVNASGAVVTKTTVLLTPEEIDQAGKKAIQYRAPGR